MLKKVISIILIITSIIILFYNSMQINNTQEKIDDIIENKISNKQYDGYIYVPSINKKLLIQSNENTLDNNLILMMSDKDYISGEYGNIILAGHNNEYAFNFLYKLDINDEIIISDFNNTYSFIVNKIEYVHVTDKYILDNVYDNKILTLITCTNNNQERYVVTAKFNHIISHN